VNAPGADSGRLELRDAVRTCLSDSADPREYVSDGVRPSRTNEELWALLSRQVGLTSILVPEQIGGAGGTIGDLAVVLEELGAGLAPVPALSTLGFATPMLVVAKLEPGGIDLLRRIGRGDISATVAWPALPDPRWSDDHDFAAGPGPDGPYVVSGETSFVLAGHEADVILVPAWMPEGVALFAVSRSTSGLCAKAMRSMDLGRALATVSLDAASCMLVCAAPHADHALTVGLDLSLVLIAAEQVGIAQRCLDSAVAYAKERVQFGRPIGSFQAIKHKLAGLLLQVELARSAMLHAVGAAEAHLAQPTAETASALRGASSMAKAMASDTATYVSLESLHVFGGLGFTWEHDSHLYFRRAKSDELLLGDPTFHRARLASVVGL
jgi:alkylation response protein AidB-like acyl-CoA dehydrogenase